MRLRRCPALLLADILGILFLQCYVLADDDPVLFFKDDEEELLPLYGEEVPDDICVEPPIPSYGEVYCGKLKTDTNRYVCKARCDSAYEFPNGEEKAKLVCDLVTGQWSPNYKFPDCQKKIVCYPVCKNGGVCKEGNVCNCPERYTGRSCEEEKCKDPPSVSNRKMSCKNSTDAPDRYLCNAVCRRGFQFTNKEKNISHSCDLKTGEWQPKYEFPACERICIPPCQNGGTCLRGNVCHCSPHFKGYKCEIDVCKDPPRPLNGKMSCNKLINEQNSYACVAECEAGYHFPKEEKRLRHDCNLISGLWTPEHAFPDCEAKCNPPCQNGGKCMAGGVCDCPVKFAGERCQHAKPESCVPEWTAYFNTDHPDSSDIGDNESLDRVRGRHDVCKGRRIKDIECKAMVGGKLVDYRELDTVGVKCSKFTGFTCYRHVRQSGCEDYAVRFLCNCGGTQKPTSPPLQMCPEVPPHIKNKCPASCPPGSACNASMCVPVDDCPCFRSDLDFEPPKAAWTTENCERCECMTGGHSRCGPMKCQDCAPGEKSVMGTNCTCTCVACPAGSVLCSSSGECVREELLCRGDIECPGVEIKCTTEEEICNPSCLNGGECEKGNKCSCASDFEGDRCENAKCHPPCQNGGKCMAGGVCDCLVRFTGERCEHENCGEPEPPQNGKVSCRKDIEFEDRYLCQAECNPGYQFPDAERTASHSCDLKSGEWVPKQEIPDCEQIPQGCVPAWTEYFNTDQPDSSEIGDDESMNRIRERHDICKGRRIKDIECKAMVDGKLVDYTELDALGLKCSKYTGFTCFRHIRQRECEDYAVRFLCDCGGSQKPTSPPLQMCPEVPPDMKNSCPAPCPHGSACNASMCVPVEDCPCFRSDLGFKPSKDAWTTTQNCERCECMTGGHLRCRPMKCPDCAPGEKSLMGAYCTCSCVACPAGSVLCPSSGECLREELCSGDPECPGFEIRCPTEICNPSCLNGGKCVEGNKCSCTSGFEGDRCENATCNPPCQNGGKCMAGGVCECPVRFTGERCEHEKLQGCVPEWTAYFNTDHPDSSDIGDNESLDRIRERHDVCNGRSIKDIECKAMVEGKLVDYRELDTLGLKCSKYTGFTCFRHIRHRECEDYAVRFLCNCDGIQKPTSPPLQLCPEVPSHIKNTCPASCPQGSACDASMCVPVDDCPCFISDAPGFKPPKAAWTTENCERCECMTGGHSRCGPKKCPDCAPGEKSVMGANCICTCVACPAGSVLCPSSGECVRKDDLCSGDTECPGVEIRCLTEICNPSCLNGGKCVEGNKCSCSSAFEGDRCEIAKCNPPCQNGGKCMAGGVCDCPVKFTGDGCQQEKPQGCVPEWTEYFNTDHPDSSEIGDDERIQRIRERHDICKGRRIKDVECKAMVDGKSVDYRQLDTVGVKCSKFTGFTCFRHIRQRECEDYAVRFLCDCVK